MYVHLKSVNYNENILIYINIYFKKRWKMIYQFPNAYWNIKSCFWKPKLSPAKQKNNYKVLSVLMCYGILSSMTVKPGQSTHRRRKTWTQ